MRDLPVRTVTAVVYGALVLLATAAPPIVFWLLVAGVGVLGMRELVAMRAGTSSLVLAAVFIGGLLCLGLLRQMGALGARHGTPPDLPIWLLLVVLPTWAADVIAYLAGSAIGRRRLAPRISPGKTWEGTIAGFIGSAVAVVALAGPFDLPRTPVVLGAILIGPAALAGDLLESYVKRRAGVKDSGTLLPGHGGVLDRVDGLVAAALVWFAVAFAWGLSQLGAEGGNFDRF